MTSFIRQIFNRSRYIVMYGAAMGVIVFLLKWLQWKYLITDNSTDIYIGLIALIFTCVGVWIANQLAKPRVETVVVEKEVLVREEISVNEAELKKLDLTAREYEVLQLLVQGSSNAEIGEKLFLSLSTVKTHVSNLFVKMNVKSRTQAIEMANRLKLVSRKTEL